MAYNRAKAAAARQTDNYKMNRKIYNAQPQVRQHKAIVRAIKRHTTPPTVSFGPGKILGGH